VQLLHLLFSLQLSYKKAARKILVKLTPVGRESGDGGVRDEHVHEGGVLGLRPSGIVGEGCPGLSLRSRYLGAAEIRFITPKEDNDDHFSNAGANPTEWPLAGKYYCTVDLLFDWFGLVCFANKTKIVSCRTADSKTGGQWYSDTSPLVFPASGFLGTCF
jgi:hypothetical protein